LLTPQGLRLLLNSASLFAGYTGQYELALVYRGMHIKLCRELQEWGNLCVGHQSETELFIWLGRLKEAERSAEDALRIAEEKMNSKEVRKRELTYQSYAYRSWVLLLAGQVNAAAAGFARANELSKTTDADGDELYSVGGIAWSELLLRANHLSLAKRRTSANLLICTKFGWNIDIARCNWMLGACALLANRLNEAESKFALAEPVLDRGQFLFDVARLQVTAGSTALSRNDASLAEDRAARAYDLAAPRGMRLVHADSLVLRGRTRLLSTNLDSAHGAVDDAEDALRIARDCGYVWAERDALYLQSDALTRLGQTEPARGAREEADMLAAQLRLTKADLDSAEAKAKQWFADWNRKKRERKSEDP
jgi:hypothetical protein